MMSNLNIDKTWGQEVTLASDIQACLIKHNKKWKLKTKFGSTIVYIVSCNHANTIVQTKNIHVKKTSDFTRQNV